MVAAYLLPPPKHHRLRFNATKKLGWATGKLSKGLAAGSRSAVAYIISPPPTTTTLHKWVLLSWLGGAASKVVANEQKPKRAEIARATGDGLANLFKAMEEASNRVVASETGGTTSAAPAREPASGSFYQGPEVVVGTPCNLENQQAGAEAVRAASRVNAQSVLRGA